MAFNVTPKCTAGKITFSDDDRRRSEKWLKLEAFSGQKPMTSKSKVKVQNPNRYAKNALQDSQVTQSVSIKAHQAQLHSQYFIPGQSLPIGYVRNTSRESSSSKTTNESRDRSLIRLGLHQSKASCFNHLCR